MLLLKGCFSFKYLIESQLCVIYISIVYLDITPIKLIGNVDIAYSSVEQRNNVDSIAKII